METADRVRTAIRAPSVLGAVGLLVTGIVLGLAGGLFGILAAIGVTVAWLFASPLVAFGVGQAALLAAVPTTTPLQLGLVQLGLFLVLVRPTVETAGPRFVAFALALFALLGVVTWYGLQLLTLVEMGALLVLVVGLTSYAIHRYERVVLGLAGGEPA